MRTIALSILILVVSWAANAAEPPNWREIWGDGAKTDWWDKSISDLRMLVEREDPLATLILADKLALQHSVESTKLRQKAIDQGVPQAMVWLADEPDTPMEEVFALSKRAAEMGYPPGQLRLAEYYFHKHLRPEYDKALALLRQAADAGYADAMLRLADTYAAGIGEPRSEGDKPMNLLRAAARKGTLEAAERLEMRLRKGIGTEIDLVESAYFQFRIKQQRTGVNNGRRRSFAFQQELNREILERLDALFEDGFEKGNRTALVELADWHENGKHGKPNLPRACALLTMANHPEAATKAKQLDETQRKLMDQNLEWMQLLLKRSR